MLDEKEVFKDQYKYFLTRVRKAKTILSELKRFTEVDTTKKLKVLAVGGEFGFIEYNLAKWTNWDITTSDVEPDLIKRYPEIRDFITVKVLNSTKLPYKKVCFDLVIFNHVIEHIVEYDKAVKEIYRVLKKKGYMYLATPNLFRRLIKPKFLLMDKKNLAAEKRIRYHLGFSTEELNKMLKDFSHVKNISREHMVNNMGLFGFIGKIMHEDVFKKYSQTNVLIARK